MSDTTSQAATMRAKARHTAPPATIHRVEADGVRVFYRAAWGSLRSRDSPAARIPSLIVHVPRADSAPGRQLPCDRSRPAWVRVHGGSGGAKICYTFDELASTMEAFTQALKLNRYAIYVFDYGAPTGFRLAMAHPDRVTAIISQNGNAYKKDLPRLGLQSGNTGPHPRRKTGRQSARIF